MFAEPRYTAVSMLEDRLSRLYEQAEEALARNDDKRLAIRFGLIERLERQLEWARAHDGRM